MIPIAKPYLTEEEAKAAHDAVLSGWVTQGPRVKEFEEKFAEYTGAKFAVAVSSCTTALHLALIVAGIREGDEVICPSLSYIATANSIRYVGANPVFADVNPDNYNIAIEDVKNKITPKTKAILIVHQMGMPADIDTFKAICEEYNLKLIEDAACAIGSKYKGKKIGTHSELVCFSFHPRKVITTGDGGMICTNRAEYYEKLLLLRQHGMNVNDLMRHNSRNLIFEEHIEIGFNYRMTDIQAAVGIKQLEKIDWILDERRKIAKKYLDELSNIKSIKLPFEKEFNVSNYQSFCIYLKPDCEIKRNDLLKLLIQNEIAAKRGIMTIHREIAYKNLGYDVALPVSENLSDNSILIPLFVPMHENETNHIISKLKNFLS